MIRELEREGTIPGAFHAPRGMLEFWVDPESPYHKEGIFEPDKEFVLFCQSAWRSALATATLLDMGLDVWSATSKAASRRGNAPVARSRKTER